MHRVDDSRHDGTSFSSAKVSTEPGQLQFAFEGREEALAHGVVIGISDLTHRGSHTCLTTAVVRRQIKLAAWRH